MPPQKRTPSRLADLIETKKSNDTPEVVQEEQENPNPEVTGVNSGGGIAIPDGKPVDKQAENFPEELVHKTPADLHSETPAETAKRYGITDEVPDDVNYNPNVTFNTENKHYQIPSGTHLHPDVARENYNRSLDGGTERGSVTRTVTETVYAREADVDDKGRKDLSPKETSPNSEAAQANAPWVDSDEFAPENKNDDKLAKSRAAEDQKSKEDKN